MSSIKGILVKLLGGAEHYMLITPLGTTVIEPLAIIYFNKTFYKVRHTKQFEHV